ncbi:MAG: TonB-dependent receptor, partial [Vicinamibacterales bacterium]
YGRYDHLITNEQQPPSVAFDAGGPYVSVPIRFGSLLGGNSSGLEVDAHWLPSAWWRLDASYSAYRFIPRVNPASLDAGAATFDGNAARQQWQLRSGFSLRRHTEVDLSVFHVGRLAGLDVPAYTRADARLQIPVTPRLTLSLIGQNLFAAAHAEFRDSSGTVIHTLVPRSARMQLAWRY